jgi:hypothetical protein
MSNWFFDRQGNPISLLTWSKLLERGAYRTIAHDRVKGDDVSTVWIGLDQTLGAGPKPMFFETMVIGDKQHELTRRYSTEAEAIEGHKQIVAALWEGREIP